jgi:hypothetical protein
VYPTAFYITESAAGVGAFRYFRLNSAYDVDTTVGSTTMPGFAEWSSFFNNYRVWYTRVRLEGAVTGLGGNALATVCLVPNSFQATLPSAAGTWSVQPLSSHRSLVNTTSGGNNMVRFDRTFQLPSIMRITTSQYKNDMDFSGTIGSNPARQGYLAVTVAGLNSSSAVSLAVQLYIAMDIEFFNPIQLST